MAHLYENKMYYEFLEFIVGKIIEVGDYLFIDDFFIFRKVFTFIEEYQIGDHYFRLMELRSIIFVDDTGLETSFDVDELPFYEELLGSLSEGSPGNTVGIFCLALIHSGSIPIVTVGRYGEECDFLISDCGFDIWILGDVSDEDDFIDGSHSILKE